MTGPCRCVPLCVSQDAADTWDGLTCSPKTRCPQSHGADVTRGGGCREKSELSLTGPSPWG